MSLTCVEIMKMHRCLFRIRLVHVWFVFIPLTHGKAGRYLERKAGGLQIYAPPASPSCLWSSVMALANAARRAPYASALRILRRGAHAVAAFCMDFARLFADAQRRRAAFLRDNPHISE
ncbi:MAG: hypothetical protein ACXIVE_17330 [Salinarimonas sp.]